jgi:hypothetical protein
MKTLKLLNPTRQFIVFLFVLTFFYACKKDEDNPDYVGTWVATGTLTEDTLILEMKDVMTFSKNTFSDIWQIKDPDTNEWIDFFGLKGTISLSGNIMNVTIKEIGMSTFDMISGMPTGNIVYYNDSQNQFSTLISQSGMAATFESEYTITGNNLTLRTDNNDDGDYNDENEVTIYTKE